MVPTARPDLPAALRVIPLAGGIAFGLTWGWLLAQRFAEPLGGPAAVVAAGIAVAALAVEAALLAGRGAAVGVLAASGAGALLRTAFSRALAQRKESV